jgi:hypothetical protein
MCYLFSSGLPLRHARYRTSHIKSNNGGTFSIRHGTPPVAIIEA